jgi:hypothetical protein
VGGATAVAVATPQQADMGAASNNSDGNAADASAADADTELEEVAWYGRASASAVQVPCKCRASAVQVPCKCRASAVQVPCNCKYRASESAIL